MPERGVFDSLNPAPLDTAVVGSRLLLFGETDSTNSRALEGQTDGLVVVADAQTAGRGRFGRPWHSAPGLGLWFSIGLNGSSKDLPFAAALAVRDGLRGIVETQLKWPNDIMHDGRKLCGLLVEQRGARTAVGAGVNVHHRPCDFPPELRDRATSLDLAAGRTNSRRDVLRAILKAMDRHVAALRAGQGDAVWQAWADACSLAGRRVSAGAIEGEVIEIERSGALRIDAGGTAQRVPFGEVAILGGETANALGCD
jgi:BirA family biotin operon repressor/biotin-[acetyl-CoA-carboxylase] ligase